MKKALLLTESSVYKTAVGDLVVRGGGPAYFHDLAKALGQMNFEVTVFALKEFKEQAIEEVIDNVKYKRFPVSSRTSLLVLKYLKAALREAEHNDIVFMNQFTPHLIMPFLKEKKKIAVVHDVYIGNGMSFWINHFGFLKGILGSFVERLQLYFDKKYADKVVVVSDATHGKFLGVVGDDVDRKVCVNPNLIDLNEFVPGDSLKVENYLLFIGRFVAYKNPAHVLVVLKRMRERFPDMKAVFVVPRFIHRTLRDFKRMQRKLSIPDDAVLIREACGNGELKSILSKAKLLIQPSLIEGQGRVPMEALASGVPVLAYDLAAYKGFLENGVNSRLVGIGDVDALSDACCDLLKNYDKYRANTHCSLKNYSYEQFGHLWKMNLEE